MLFTDCRARFAAYVAENLRLSVHLEIDGVPVPATFSVGAEFTVRIVDSNHPGGVIDPTPSEDPPDGSNLQDIRFHVTSSPPGAILLLVDPALENTTFRDGWDVDAPILTPGSWVSEMYVHFTAEHPTFDLPTNDVLDDLVLRGQVGAEIADGTVAAVTATARATPRWRELSQPAQSATVILSPGN
jgi:hypothetical protein